ncbi:MAG: tetratricopeptide repeat protein, partial [Planctomycetales bacterium]|nr:tetratricopeptide repeat protein [Planctomycetales bacterium]
MSAFLADFGLAKSVATGSKLTRTGEALGTPAYMSPEQARGEVSSLTPATDVWSLGCVLYAMLAGRSPFEGETDAAVVGQVLLREPASVRGLRPDAPPGLERVVLASLAKRSRERYRDAGALREDLQRVLGGVSPRARRPGRRRRILGALAAAGLATAAALAAAPLWPAGEARPASAPVRPEAPAKDEVETLAGRAAALRTTAPRRAAVLLGEALRSAPDRHALRLDRGLLLWAVGDSEAARAEWERVVGEATGAEVSRARLFLGLEATFRLENQGAAGQQARSQFEALREAPGDEGRIARGALRAGEGDWSKARDELRDAEGWEATLLRAYVEGCDPSGSRETAVRLYQDSIEQGIPFAWAYFNRGLARRQLGDLPRAIVDFDAALALAPRFPGPLLYRGLARHESGDLAGAIADYSAALAMDPRTKEALCGRGAARASLGDLTGGLADLADAVALDPGYEDA